jgi:hypothetical protein
MKRPRPTILRARGGVYLSPRGGQISDSRTVATARAATARPRVRPVSGSRNLNPFPSASRGAGGAVWARYLSAPMRGAGPADDRGRSSGVSSRSAPRACGGAPVARLDRSDVDDRLAVDHVVDVVGVDGRRQRDLEPRHQRSPPRAWRSSGRSPPRRPAAARESGSCGSSRAGAAPPAAVHPLRHLGDVALGLGEVEQQRRRRRRGARAPISRFAVSSGSMRLIPPGRAERASPPPPPRRRPPGARAARAPGRRRAQARAPQRWRRGKPRAARC